MKTAPFRLLLCAVACVAAQACARFGYELLDPDENVGVTPGPGHCTNQMLDADETDTDCGGQDCGGCGDGAGCASSTDCASTTCQASTCRAATCADGAQSSDETGTDCGGGCAPCGPGSSCVGSGDCDSQNCESNSCQEATCSDAIQNQDETGTDCGGSTCSACETCSDGSQNQDETGVDCGGTLCAACPACSDGAQNQDETGVDCGGTLCAACPTCSDGAQNQDETGVDCGGSTCSACETCSDGSQNQDETGIDCGGVCTACGVNTPPLARMTVTPGVGVHDGTATVFQGDASATTDREDAAVALTYSWDWDNDGTTDDTGATSTHTYGAAGLFEARVVVQDTGGMTASASFLVVVNSSTNLVLVTTAVDENDGGATPGSPGGTGLSLREAITFANGTAGRQSILVPAGFSIALSSELPSPSDGSGVDIVGDGVLVDGAGLGGSDDCVSISAAQTRLFGLEIQNCSRSPLRLAVAAANTHLSRLNVHDNGEEVFLNGNNVRFGPDNEVSRSADVCVGVVSIAATVERNYIHDCTGRGLVLTGSSDGTLVIGNILARSAPGILFGNGADNTTLIHNVVHANTADGINAGTTGSGVVMQNNVFSANVGFGLRASDSIFAANDHNSYFDNTVGTCSACSLGTGSLTSDPQYMDVASDDFRLQPSSPNIDTGIDTGNDVNGAAPGNGLFNGANPDIGARESP